MIMTLIWAEASERAKGGRRGIEPFFLVIAALNLADGSWYLTIDRSASART
jgi:hypothetical protein